MKRKARIIKNKARCKACGVEIQSKHRHDIVYCKCVNGGIFVDGGKDYLRRGGDMDNFIDLCEYEEEK